MVTTLPPLWPSGHRHHTDVLRIAHRGAPDGTAPYGRENLARIAHLGIHLLEFDIQITCDGALVVAHDPDVVTISGAMLPVAESSLDELQAAGTTDEVDLDLDGVVRRAREAGLGLYVDVKTLTAASATSLARVIDREGMAKRTILASADPAVVVLLGGAAPALPLSILFTSTELDPLDLARSVGAHFVHPCWEYLARPHEVLANASWFAPSRRAGVGIVCWHVEDRGIAEGLYALGVDGVCTDEPTLLASVATNPGGPASEPHTGRR